MYRWQGGHKIFVAQIGGWQFYWRWLCKFGTHPLPKKMIAPRSLLLYVLELWSSAGGGRGGSQPGHGKICPDLRADSTRKADFQKMSWHLYLILHFALIYFSTIPDRLLISSFFYLLLFVLFCFVFYFYLFVCFLFLFLFVCGWVGVWGWGCVGVCVCVCFCFLFFLAKD